MIFHLVWHLRDRAAEQHAWLRRIVIQAADAAALAPARARRLLSKRDSLSGPGGRAASAVRRQS